MKNIIKLQNQKISQHPPPGLMEKYRRPPALDPASLISKEPPLCWNLTLRPQHAISRFLHYLKPHLAPQHAGSRGSHYLALTPSKFSYQTHLQVQRKKPSTVVLNLNPLNSAIKISSVVNKFIKSKVFLTLFRN